MAYLIIEFNQGRLNTYLIKRYGTFKLIFLNYVLDKVALGDNVVFMD